MKSDLAPHETTMVDMLGLRRRLVRAALLAVVFAYIASGLLLGPIDGTPLQFWSSIVGTVGLGLCLWVVSTGDEDPLDLWSTVVAAAVGPLSIALVWWSIPVGPTSWVRPSAPLMVYSVVAILMILRGRARWTWVAFAAVAVVAAVAWLGWGWTAGVAVPAVLKLAVAMIPATLTVFFVRPLLDDVRVLDRREIRAAENDATLTATRAERARRLAEFDAEVRPFLAQAAAGTPFSADDAQRARLLEHRLRDSVRGRGWSASDVADAVATARRRGVEVRLFDDRPAGAKPVPADVRAELVELLDSTDAGSVTARALPVGRGPSAVVSVVSGDTVRRRVWD